MSDEDNYLDDDVDMELKRIIAKEEEIKKVQKFLDDLTTKLVIKIIF